MEKGEGDGEGGGVNGDGWEGGRVMMRGDDGEGVKGDDWEGERVRGGEGRDIG